MLYTALARMPAGFGGLSPSAIWRPYRLAFMRQEGTAVSTKLSWTPSIAAFLRGDQREGWVSRLLRFSEFLRATQVPVVRSPAKF
ncbi:MAG: hypothetical protein ABWK05_00895 [Pyrobaculum sp.]